MRTCHANFQLMAKNSASRFRRLFAIHNGTFREGRTYERTCFLPAYTVQNRRNCVIKFEPGDLGSNPTWSTGFNRVIIATKLLMHSCLAL